MHRSYTRHLLATCLVLTAAWLGAQVPVNPNASSSSGQANRLTGAGSSFVYPLMSKWASVYHSKTKVQAQIQEDQVRVSGKKRDDLQEAIALIKSNGYDLPLQFVNFRE